MFKLLNKAQLSFREEEQCFFTEASLYLRTQIWALFITIARKLERICLQLIEIHPPDILASQLIQRSQAMGNLRSIEAGKNYSELDALRSMDHGYEKGKMPFFGVFSSMSLAAAVFPAVQL